jgi:hypothetical protein
MQTKEYTWLGVHDMQALLRKVKQGTETSEERLPIINLRGAVSVTPTFYKNKILCK